MVAETELVAMPHNNKTQYISRSKNVDHTH